MKTFAGIPQEFAGADRSKVTLIPVAYDGTSTWGKGADKGPEAFLDAAENMELYDIETGTEVYREGIYLHQTLEGFTTPDAMVEAVYAKFKDQYTRGKLVSMIGGEHSVSIGAIRATAEFFDDVTVVQLDAHTDLRESYLGSKYNHACALFEAQQTTNLIQVGIRSMDKLEQDRVDPERVFYAHELEADEFWMDKAIDLMTDNVYITIDLDAFDPSILPATGTPEPGGMLWYETLYFLQRIINEKKLVGFDIVELCPNEHSKPSNFLAAKLYYKILSYHFTKEE
jgi:agmatinase